MHILTYGGLALGLLLLIGLLIWQGAVEVINLLYISGWQLLFLPLIWLPNLLPATQGWRLLFQPSQIPSFRIALMAMWIARAVNNLLPVASLGGEIVKARLAHQHGSAGIDAAASVMVDKVVQAMSVALWGFTGVCCLLYLSDDTELALYAFSGFFILSLCAGGFLLVQKAGMLGFLAKIGGKLVKTESWEGISFNAREIDASIATVYGRKKQLFLALILRTLALMLQSAEVWLACYLLGYPVGILEAIMLRSLTATLTDIAFIIPNGYGIQEGAFILVGQLVGLDANAALAVSLSLRIRDVMLDPAGLMYLHHIESRAFSRRKRNPEINS